MKERVFGNSKESGCSEEMLNRGLGIQVKGSLGNLHGRTRALGLQKEVVRKERMLSISQ